MAYDRPCSLPGCVALVKGNGLCTTHYMQQLRGEPFRPQVSRQESGRRSGAVRLESQKSTAERFFSKVDKAGPNGCWLWAGVLMSRCHQFRYGVLKVPNGKRWSPRTTHRVSWELHNGPIPAGLCVLHKCDNPPCVNPDHLFLGTRADNVADMIAKGRKVVLRGADHPTTKRRALSTQEMPHE